MTSLCAELVAKIGVAFVAKNVQTEQHRVALGEDVGVCPYFALLLRVARLLGEPVSELEEMEQFCGTQKTIDFGKHFPESNDKRMCACLPLLHKLFELHASARRARLDKDLGMLVLHVPPAPVSITHARALLDEHWRRVIDKSNLKLLCQRLTTTPGRALHQTSRLLDALCRRVTGIEDISKQPDEDTLQSFLKLVNAFGLPANGCPQMP